MHDRSLLATIGQAVRERRVALGLRQVELAELSGCSTRFVHTLEAAKPTLRLDKLLDVLGVLGLRLEVRPAGDHDPEGPFGGGDA
jgi:HTH-type transcriptional regulator/antitoxin HipB